ncbi:hypothetical protein FD879_17050 [Acinetobacter baumannii]|nr:hypothetical protein F6W75_16625 [Acinetobacter baumannii]MDQ5999488.1 hypothetical protein [Acinetobacter baumannii]MDQ6003219.1 hypothetical protein [Acinetobacter baumannii]MDQ6018216.1 hypothetical protein [Acinetobacter baumannii]MDQ6028906.1 hypothetical protein [Acinetobacter baumannii]
MRLSAGGKSVAMIFDSNIVLNWSASNFIVTTPNIADKPPSLAMKSAPFWVKRVYPSVNVEFCIAPKPS